MTINNVPINNSRVSFSLSPAAKQSESPNSFSLSPAALHSESPNSCSLSPAALSGGEGRGEGAIARYQSMRPLLVSLIFALLTFPTVLAHAIQVESRTSGVESQRLDKILVNDVQELDIDRKQNPDDEKDAIVLFDGETLKGWRGEDGLWSVVDGAITGQTSADAPMKANTFLICESDMPEDFELRLQFRIESGNSGIQFRSDEDQPNRLKGYQADIDSQMRYMGILYEERERGILCERGQHVTIGEDGKKTQGDKLGLDDEAFAKTVGTPGWHDYTILVSGSHIEFRIDGITTAIIDDNQTEEAARDGLLGLQLHQGPPMKVQFRNIRLLPAAANTERGK